MIMNSKNYSSSLYNQFVSDKEQLLSTNQRFQVITVYEGERYLLFGDNKKVYLSQFDMKVYAVCSQNKYISYDKLFRLILSEYREYPEEIIVEHFFKTILKLKRNNIIYGKSV